MSGMQTLQRPQLKRHIHLLCLLKAMQKQEADAEIVMLKLNLELWAVDSLWIKSSLLPFQYDIIPLIYPAHINAKRV